MEETYKSLLNELENIRAKHNDLMRKHMEAQVAQGLEKEQKGERFILIDPARLPESPYKPNRMAIVLIGLVLGVGAGVGWASLREFSDYSIRDSESLVMATSFPVLAGIPEIVTDQDRLKQKRKRILLIIGLVVCVIAAVALFHFLVMDLNVFWAKVMRRMG